ncbi:MAG: PH domain-containing protein [Methanobacteriaceae archaeon]|jgi:membrane protein YdbS with pleckstrin-like domain|nr:PH domain-containing protein [Candidatus Methanorudis spinitermitis]
MYDKNKNDSSDEIVLFKARPNLFFSSKQIFLLVMVLGAISYLTPIILLYIAEIQVYLVNIINLPLTSVSAFLIFIISFLLIVWIIWILLNWRATEYIITNFKIILKKGILIKKSHYMPFYHIQDITVSQGIISRIFSIGDVVVVNAYDLTDIEFIDVSNPEYIQDLIFNEMNKNYYGINEGYNYNFPENNYSDYNSMNNLRNDNYYQVPNQFNNHQFDDLNYEHYKSQNQHNNENNFNHGYYAKNPRNEKNSNLNNNDNLNHSIEEAMTNFNHKNPPDNEIQKNYNDYQSNIHNNPYKDQNDRYHFKERSKNKEHEKITENKNNKNLSIIDAYSKKFKKREK